MSGKSNDVPMIFSLVLLDIKDITKTRNLWVNEISMHIICCIELGPVQSVAGEDGYRILSF